MRFRATLELGGKTATGMRIPAAVVEALGAGKRPAVKVTINGFTYRSTVAVMGGDYMVGVNADNRAGAGVEAGDVLDVDIELDTEERTVEVPAELAAAFRGNAGARQAFEALSYSNQRRLAEPISRAKAPETRQRNVDKAIAVLSK